MNKKTSEGLCPRSIIGILSASELTLGSYLHALRIPLSGQLMSLNQCFWLNTAKIWSPEYSGTKISMQVAATKMMSPIGKRITPMLAITMQGFLFEIGSRLGGRITGSIFLSIWAFIQPLIMYFLFLGNTLWDMIQFFSDSIGISLYSCLVLMLISKIILAITVSVIAGKVSSLMVLRFGSWIQSLEQTLTPRTPFWSRSKKILRSPVTICLTLLSIYLYFTTNSTEFFIRQMLFYLCWTFAAFYLFDLVGEKILRYMISSTESPTEISQGSE